MKIDLYTKAVLTVIALCLIWICVNGATPVARAQAGPPQPTPVILVDGNGMPIYQRQGLRVHLVNDNGTSIYTAQGLRVNAGPQPLPVALSTGSAAVPVAVRAIQRGSTWDPILVSVLREPPTLAPIP